jgi:hypothetical protein
VHYLVLSGLPIGFDLPIGFYWHLDDIRVLWVPFGSVSLSFSFLQGVLDEDVPYANAISRLGVV